MLQTKKVSDGYLDGKAKDRASYVAEEFDRARGKDTAYHASHALHSLSHHVSQGKLRIRVESAEQIVRSIDAASAHVRGLFRDHLERAQAALALNKAKVAARRWAQDRESGDTAAAHNDLRNVLWLRNCCHNQSLFDEIEEFHSTRARDARISRQTERLFRLPRN
mgnify:CR=1 FL=1|tara:strand:- start:3216 stop:3710 length:495 start_codon:yes stop_codon:yes gene_type:complete